MNASRYETDDAVLAKLGERLKRRRLDLNLTQADLARDAGLSKRTVERIEAGETSQTPSLIRILRSLDLLKHIDALIPPPVQSPIEQWKHLGRQRQRGSSLRSSGSSSGRPDRGDPWTWGDAR